jgi:hypothetical protein
LRTSLVLSIYFVILSGAKNPRICFCFFAFIVISTTTDMLSLAKRKNPSFRPKRSEVEKPASQRTPSASPCKNFTIPTAVLAAVILSIALSFASTPAHAQGCTQCQDNTAATPPATQKAYRHAIILMTVTAGFLFVTTLVLFKRHR